jgi:hypothetical protein
MKSPTAVTHDDMTDLPINLKYLVSRHKRLSEPILKHDVGSLKSSAGGFYLLVLFF